MSRRKDMLAWGLVLVALGLIIAAALYVVWPQLQSHTTLRMGDGVFTTRVAATDETREKGLAGSSELRADQAFLFVFETDDEWPISMKDVGHSIDILWLDKNKEVVYIVKNAPPESYPYETFVSKQPARYVVALAAGTVGKKSIKVGTQAVFDETNLEGFGL